MVTANANEEDTKRVSETDRARTPDELRYLHLLSSLFPTTQAAFTKIINLEAKVNLPRGAEHFMSDVHGEYGAFLHILNNCSGVIREHVEEVFGNKLDDFAKDELCTLIYYPHERLAQLRLQHHRVDDGLGREVVVRVEIRFLHELFRGLRRL